MVNDYDAILFDWDGTLVDSHAAHFQSLREVMGEQGIVVDRDWFMSETGMSTAESITLLARRQHVTLTLPLAELVRRCESIYLDNLDHVREVTAVVDIARSNHGLLPMAVASGGLRASITATMAALDLTELFDVVVTREDVAAGKPAPDIFLAAAERLNVSAGRCLVYEDSEAGIAAARAAGATVVDIRQI
ncbi:HAD family hydrolase [Micromonospora wenchangensis]|uniref:HAD family hydrolase n=1 Tax=Micromonospora wenchangensis TaxID=1185415 RepID=UPI00382BB8D6